MSSCTVCCVIDDKLMIDFFLDDYQSPAQTEEKAADRVDIRDVFSQIQSMLGEAAVRKIGGVFTFKLTGAFLKSLIVTMVFGRGQSALSLLCRPIAANNAVFYTYRLGMNLRKT